MELMRSFYKTSSLARNGIFLLVSMFVLLVAGAVFIPSFKYDDNSEQVYTLKGVNFKYNDAPFVSHFFNSIKANDGYLCIGTSETSPIDGGNYYDFLNNDPDLDMKFSLSAGAGRTCGTYIPVFLEHKEEVKGLKIIYLINPVYWGSNVSKVRKDYWSRYSNYGLAASVDLTEAEETKYYTPVNDYFDALNIAEKAAYTLEYWIRNARRHYFNDLTFLLKPEKYKTQQNYFPATKRALDTYPHFGEIDVQKIDTVKNIAHDFHNPEWFKSIDLNENHRYNELSSFIDLCNDLGIEATFIVGNYNERFIKHYDPGSLSPYVEVTQKVKAMLNEKGADYIDATDLSNVPGAFRDHQHHSNYGAYLIYRKIKNHIIHE